MSSALLKDVEEIWKNSEQRVLAAFVVRRSSVLPSQSRKGTSSSGAGTLTRGLLCTAGREMRSGGPKHPRAAAAAQGAPPACLARHREPTMASDWLLLTFFQVSAHHIVIGQLHLNMQHVFLSPHTCSRRASHA